MTPTEDHDIYRHIRERHNQWLRDALSLYEMAGAEDTAALDRVFSALMETAISILGICDRVDLNLYLAQLHKSVTEARATIKSDAYVQAKLKEIRRDS